jgi:hypothetical protein
MGGKLYGASAAIVVLPLSAKRRSLEGPSFSYAPTGLDGRVWIDDGHEFAAHLVHTRSSRCRTRMRGKYAPE